MKKKGKGERKEKKIPPEKRVRKEGKKE